ncbi:MAG TPA: hypothetical protein VFA68_11915 [Terriglobales bacterium]|nr:hypothetical protein [Terriglobales bacterium]
MTSRMLGMAVILAASLAAGDTITMKDGTTHTGTIVSGTAHSISFREKSGVHRYSKANIQSISFDSDVVPATSASSARLGAGTREATLPAGTEITVLSNQEIDSKTASEGQVFPADVAEDVRNSAGQVVIPKGSEAELVIRRVQSAGTVTGSSDLALDLKSVKVGGRRYTVSTEDVEQKGREGLGTNKRTAEMVGGGAVLGTLIGAIAGGGKGAAIGAATGGAAGAGAQVLTRGKSVKVPAESKLSFKLDQPLRLSAAY